VVSLDEILDAILGDAVDAALAEAWRAQLPLCEACFAWHLARRMVLELLPLFYDDFYKREPRARITGPQYQAMVREAGKSAVHARCDRR
jgi:hypothetical protein